MAGGWSIQAICGLGALTVLAMPVAAAPVPDDWVTVAAGSLLTIEAPAGTRFESARGADSFVGKFVGPNFVLSLDYGAFSDPLTDRSRFADYSMRTVSIEGRSARVIEAKVTNRSDGPSEFIGLHVPAIAQSGRGPLSLTMTSVVSDAAANAVVHRIFETIRLTPAR
jgi:hypothetical protein